ncbi:hypothetical protein C9374_012079 [Naegleria lovaniensis]|uniref:Uncharacterized protein n=1 Tax=Naegleria lovaniensis TaxID=51637 RepID=A0AA88G8Q8_NAELO|nr:uncharacterized protein C9374_012079 [Naegleria lovaniensis]KAG2373472.1 hypothetical protein C9374_012079 [Naegleria lovaniensis]
MDRRVMIHLRRSSSSLLFSSLFESNSHHQGDDEEPSSYHVQENERRVNLPSPSSDLSFLNIESEDNNFHHIHHQHDMNGDHQKSIHLANNEATTLHRKVHQKSYSFSILNGFGNDYNEVRHDGQLDVKDDTTIQHHHHAAMVTTTPNHLNTIQHSDNTALASNFSHQNWPSEDFSSSPTNSMHSSKQKSSSSAPSTLSTTAPHSSHSLQNHSSTSTCPNSSSSKNSKSSLVTSSSSSQDKFLIWWIAFILLLILLMAISFGLMSAIPEIKRRRIENTPYWDEALKAKEEKRKLSMQHGMWHNITVAVLGAIHARRGGPTPSTTTLSTINHNVQPVPSIASSSGYSSGAQPSASTSLSDSQMESLSLRMRGLVGNALKISSRKQEQGPSPQMSSKSSSSKTAKIMIIEEHDKKKANGHDSNPISMSGPSQQPITSLPSNEYLLKNLDHPFLDSKDMIEKQYFANHILLSHDLNPFYIVNSSALTSWKDFYKTLLLKYATESFSPSLLRPIDEKFEQDFFRRILIREKSVYSRMSSAQLKSQFFGPSLKRRIANSKFVDWRANHLLYDIDRTHESDTSFQYQVTSRRSTFKVHVKFNDVKYRDDFLEYPRVTEKSRERYCENNYCETDYDMANLPPHSDTQNAANHSTTHKLCILCETNIPKTQSSHFYKGLCYKPNLDLAIVSIENGILDYGLHDPSKIFSIFDSHGNLFAQDQIGSTSALEAFKHYNLEYHSQLASIGPIQIPSPSEPDNFFIEIVPRLILMDSYLPLEIPIVLHEEIGVEKIDLLQQYGMISPARQFLFAASGIPTFHMAQRLYFLFSKDISVVPRTPDIALRVASNVMNKAMRQFTTVNSSILELLLDASQRPYLLVVEKDSNQIGDNDDEHTHTISNRQQLLSSMQEFCNSKGLSLVHLKIPTIRSTNNSQVNFTSTTNGSYVILTWTMSSGQQEQQKMTLSFIEIGKLFHQAQGVISLFDFPLSHYLLFMKKSSSSTPQTTPSKQEVSQQNDHAMNLKQVESTSMSTNPTTSHFVLEIGSRETLHNENYCVARALGLKYYTSVIVKYGKRSRSDENDNDSFEIDVGEVVQLLSTELSSSQQ